MEWAFRAPAFLKERLGGQLDAGRDRGDAGRGSRGVFREKPALHRYPGSMAKRTHALAQFLVEHYDGRADRRVGRGRDAAPSCCDGSRPSRASATPRPASSSACSASASACSRRAGRTPRPTGPRSPTSTASTASIEIREEKRAVKAAKKGGGGDEKSRRTPSTTQSMRDAGRDEGCRSPNVTDHRGASAAAVTGSVAARTIAFGSVTVRLFVAERRQQVRVRAAVARERQVLRRARAEAPRLRGAVDRDRRPRRVLGAPAELHASCPSVTAARCRAR